MSPRSGRGDGSTRSSRGDDDVWIAGAPEEPIHRSRRQRRRDDFARQRAKLRDQRGSEPASPIGVIAVIVLLAILVLGIGGGLPRLLNSDSNDRGPVGLLTPGAPGSEIPEPTQATSTGQEPSGTALTTPPVQTQRPGATATASANEVARNWANVFYTRKPATETYEQLVDRAAQYTTSELAATFSSAGDATYDALKADGGTSRVVSVTVTSPRPDTAPVDTPTRITRLLTVKVATTGKRAAQFDVPLLVTVVLDGGRWLVSALDGGTGP